MLEVENNLDKKINHKKEIIKYVSIAIDCLEKANGNVANAIDNLGDSLVEIRESKIDNNQLYFFYIHNYVLQLFYFHLVEFVIV